MKKTVQSSKILLLHPMRYALCAVFLLLFTCAAFAGEPPTIITSDTLEHDRETSIYTAKGSVKVVQGGTTIEALEMKYDEKTSNVFPEGDVRYDDQKISVKAERAEYNLDTKTGTFYNAEIFSKRDNFHISGTEVEKRGENEYFFKEASMTSCDAASPEWCFRGNEVDIIIGDRIKARDATFNIQGFPVLYTPYFWAPALTERKTGFLTPAVGYSKAKNFYYRQPFFWAISEDKDATLILDWYTKRGFGEGIEYRYVDLGNVGGTHWLYHIHDKTLGRNFYELRSQHERRQRDGLSLYTNLNLLSGKNFYREYGRHRYDRIKRFLESTGEVSLPTDNSRIYLMSQYLVDLKDGSRTGDILQRLPEFGYVINPYRIGPAVFSLTSSAANFWRERGVYGQRLDIYPKLSHSFGDEVVLSQNLGLRETAYSLHRNEDAGYKDSVQRKTIDYNITAASRILKEYPSFTHAIEPALGYTLVPGINKDRTNLPLFDSTEFYSRQSTVTLSLVNRIFDKKGEFVTVSLSESYNFLIEDRPFSPLTIGASIGRPIQLRGDVSYNRYSHQIETINSEVNINMSRVTILLGERFNRVADTLGYDFGVNYAYSKNLSTEARLWYDAKGGGARDASLKVRYQKQCWGVTMVLNRKPPDEINQKPADYSVLITFDLLGLGSNSFLQ
ncbi:MAG: LPS assembly protein LptD [Thermodesulfovibrionales bacterium]